MEQVSYNSFYNLNIQHQFLQNNKTQNQKIFINNKNDYEIPKITGIKRKREN
jgi:hypothetical protein